ncbi:hypothetical protein BDR05DRAFT_959537, partial [Suillus weaverae]
HHPHPQEDTTSPNNIRPPHHPPTRSHYGGPHPRGTNSTPSQQLGTMGLIQFVPLGQYPSQSARQQAFSFLPSSSDDHP